MQQQLFLYKKSPISYYRFGKGKKVLVAFHGYNQTGNDFGYFEDVLEDYFTIIAIDFFWHGKSEWREEMDFTESDMKEIVLEIAKQEHLVARKFSVCSFSMGARMARALVRKFPDRIEYLILLSPPTFGFNRFLNFTTGNYFGLRIFRYFVNHHQVLLNWVKFLNRIKILNRSVYLFSSKFIGQPKRLEKVYKTWYSQRKLRTNFNMFFRLIEEHSINVILVVGNNDYITPPQKMIAYIRKLSNRQIFIVRKKHELATPETKQIFLNLFSLK